MHSEFYSMSQQTASILNKTKENGGRIIAVGTTTTRTLESILLKDNKFKECSGWTDIFIYPGFKFKAIDCLITNFHLPKSTLVMLVSALAGRENILNAYKIAVKNNIPILLIWRCNVYILKNLGVIFMLLNIPENIYKKRIVEKLNPK